MKLLLNRKIWHFKKRIDNLIENYEFFEGYTFLNFKLNTLNQNHSTKQTLIEKYGKIEAVNRKI